VKISLSFEPLGHPIGFFFTTATVNAISAAVSMPVPTI